MVCFMLGVVFKAKLLSGILGIFAGRLPSVGAVLKRVCRTSPERGLRNAWEWLETVADALCQGMGF